MNFDYEHRESRVEEIKTVEDFINLVYYSLNYWKKIHTDRFAWSLEWIPEGAEEYCLEECPVISNDYFEFDLKDAVLTQWCKANLDWFNQCSICGMINENGFEDCECIEEELDPEFEDLTIEELKDWIEEIYCDSLPNGITEFIIRKALETEGFDCYYESVYPVFCGALEEVESAIELLENSKNNQEILTNVLWCSHVAHVHGNVVKDYHEHVCYDYYSNQIESIQQAGLTSVFSQEEIEEFLNS